MVKHFRSEKCTYCALVCANKVFAVLVDRHKKVLIFTREYTQCTAGYTFCFVSVGVVVVVVVVVATFNQTWQYFS
jgi:hypothetical protein